MPIFANTTSSTPEFNLIRVLPGGAGKTLIFTFFDVGDAATSGTMTVLRPTDATGSALTGCKAVGYQSLTLPTCSLSGISNGAGWNGKSESIYVPIPPQLLVQLQLDGRVLVQGAGQLRVRVGHRRHDVVGLHLRRPGAADRVSPAPTAYPERRDRCPAGAR